jgi:hypothetical protein
MKSWITVLPIWIFDTASLISTMVQNGHENEMK